MKRIGLAGAAIVLLLPLLAAARSKEGTGGVSREEIDNLIKQLASDRYSEREFATNELVTLGTPALPALGKAMTDVDLEVSARARLAIKMIVKRVPRKQAELRRQAQELFRSARYGEMIQRYVKLTVPGGEATMFDFLWLGHACQLHGDWARAAAAYQRVVRLLDDEINTLAERSGRGRDPEKVRDNLIRQRVGLSLWIGRIQSEECKDPRAAAATVDEALRRLEGLKQPHLASRVLIQLATMQEQAGQVSEALGSWIRLNRRYQAGRPKPRSSTNPLAIDRVPGLIARLPAGANVPRVPGIFLLSPAKPTQTFDLDDANALAEAFGAYTTRDSGYWSFCLCPPPGKEFATLTVAVDFEQIKLRYGGWFQCWVRAAGGRPGQVQLANMVWRKDRPGRDVCTQKLDVPPGADAVYIRPGRWGGKFKVFTATASATFRPRGRPGAALAGRIWMQTEALPKGGKLTRDGQPLRSETAYTNVKPGRSVFRYELPGRADGFEATGELVAGRRYGLFANLDSPFRSALTNLVGLAGDHQGAYLSAGRLGDGRWLAAWMAPGRTVMTATSKDLVTWDKPRPLPFGSIFRSISPAVAAGPDGKVLLAWFSKRLDPDPTSWRGYRLWLTTTADGQRWSPPRPIGLGVAGREDAESVQFVRPAGGKLWMFWRDLAAEGDKPKDIQDLQPIILPNSDQLSVRGTHVAVAPAGTMHMVFGAVARDIYYSRSKDGWEWQAPRAIVEGRQNALCRRPQLVFAGTSAGLVYERNDGAYLCPFRAGDAPSVGEGVKITNHVVPLNGSRLSVGADGQAVVFAGKGTAWVLRAKAADVCGVAGGAK